MSDCAEAQRCRYLARLTKIRMPAPADACVDCPLVDDEPPLF